MYAEIDELVASTAHWTEHITELTKAVAELDVAVATATSIREEEKDKNTVRIKLAGCPDCCCPSAQRPEGLLCQGGRGDLPGAGV